MPPVIPARPAHTISQYTVDLKVELPKGDFIVPNVAPPIPPKMDRGDIIRPEAPPRLRKKKPEENTQEIIANLRKVCNPADPTTLYRQLVKIGQG
jgi:hypothetical protein